MALQFEDIETIVVNADLLSLCEPCQYIETKERPTNYRNLHWWLRCYPNGNGEENRGHVGVFIYTSIGGIEARYTLTIDQSDIERECDESYENRMNIGYARLASHDELRSESIIQNGVFVIRCKINFKVNLAQLPNNIALAPIREDSCVVKFDRKTLAIYKPGQDIIGEEQTVDGVTWWIEYYPRGYRKEDKGYVSVFFHVTGGPINMECSCAMSIGGVPIKKFISHRFGESGSVGTAKWFSHEQCRFADHKNNVIDLVCKVKFTKNMRKNPFSSTQC